MAKEIHDIFSKRLKKKGIVGKKLKVIVDFRERNSRLPALLVKRGFGVEFKELKIGDYVIGDVVIERKEVRDFVGSIINKRVMRQLLELSQYERKFLFIEGGINLSDEKYLGINSNAIRGFLLSIGLRYNVPIIFTKDAEDSSKFMWILANKKSRGIDLNFKKKARNKKEQLEFILEGFIGIGPKGAKSLLEKFGSLEGVFGADFEELEKVLGKKAGVFDLLNEKY